MNRCRNPVFEDEAIVAMDIEDRLTATGSRPMDRAASGDQSKKAVYGYHIP